MSQYTEGYRSGHNGAVLKTVRAKAHAGSNPAPSAKIRAVILMELPFFSFYAMAKAAACLSAPVKEDR